MPARKTEKRALRPPCFVPPLLPTPVETPPAGEGWLHEIKHDGYRTQLVIDRGKVRAFSRNGHDWTEKYPRVASDAADIRCRSAVLDGEVIVQDEHGRSDLGALYQAMAEEPHRVVFFAFDVLHLNGKDLCPLPLSVRKGMLADLIGDANPLGAVHVSKHFDGDGTTLFAAAERMQLEGIVSKRSGSRYKSGRCSFWQKTKCMTEGEFVVVGLEPNPGGAPFALLAREAADGLVYAGSARPPARPLRRRPRPESMPSERFRADRMGI
jgi:ATP-dependent DNA ligase